MFFYTICYTERMEIIKEDTKKTPLLDVYTSAIFSTDTLTPLYPPEREYEIKNAKNKSVQKQKYFVWKLLAYALKHSFGKDITEFTFEKSTSGKWKCDGVEFSLAHCKTAVAVAVSAFPVGVDIEIKKREIDEKVAQKILSEREYLAYLSSNEKREFLLKKWVEKESIFKSLDQSGFFTSQPKAYSTRTWVAETPINGEKYLLGVASDYIESLRIIPFQQHRTHPQF